MKEVPLKPIGKYGFFMELVKNLDLVEVGVKGTIKRKS